MVRNGGILRSLDGGQSGPTSWRVKSLCRRVVRVQRDRGHVAAPSGRVQHDRLYIEVSPCRSRFANSQNLATSPPGTRGLWLTT